MSIALFITAPVNIYISLNTFVRYLDQNNVENVGQIVDMHESRHTVPLRQFLTMAQIIEQFNQDMPNIGFWPRGQANHPPYLCAIDRCITIATSSITGLAFVLYYNDPLVRQVIGLANTFIVSSAFSTESNIIFHARTFLSFPSLYAESQLLSCFPSMIFMQLLRVKETVQLLLHSRSKNKKCMQSCTIHNINPLTWNYMTSVLQLQYQEKNVVIKKNYIISDEFHMEKYRALQISTFLCLPDHLAMAQQLFGNAVGLGSRKIIKCSLKRRAVTARQIARQQINYTDSLNVIPFQVEVQHNEEYQRRGILIKYIPSESELSITAKYRKLSGRMQLEPHLLMRKIARRNEPEMGDDSYPLFADTDVFGSTIAEINLGMEMVTLQNNNQKSIQEVMDELDRLI